AAHMRQLMGVFFAYVAVSNVLKIVRPGQSDGVDRAVAEGLPWYRKAAVGGPMGLLAGLLGIGGGALAVPMQHLVLRMPLRNAIATSAATIASISWLGAIVKNVSLGDN